MNSLCFAGATAATGGYRALCVKKRAARTDEENAALAELQRVFYMLKPQAEMSQAHAGA